MPLAAVILLDLSPSLVPPLSGFGRPKYLAHVLKYADVSMYGSLEKARTFHTSAILVYQAERSFEALGLPFIAKSRRVRLAVSYSAKKKRRLRFGKEL